LDFESLFSPFETAKFQPRGQAMTGSRPEGVECLMLFFGKATWRCPKGGKATEQFRPFYFIK